MPCKGRYYTEDEDYNMLYINRKFFVKNHNIILIIFLPKTYYDK